MEDDDNEQMDFILPINSDGTFKTFTERYFTQMFRKYEVNNENQDQYALLHSNKLFLVGITKNHEIIRKNLNIENISFECIFQGNINDFVKGKKKKGGVKIQHNTVICHVQADGKLFRIRGVVDGFIIEFNQNLITNPNLLKQFVKNNNFKPESKGFIAIVNPGTLSYKKQADSLIQKENY